MSWIEFINGWDDDDERSEAEKQATKYWWTAWGMMWLIVAEMYHDEITIDEGGLLIHHVSDLYAMPSCHTWCMLGCRGKCKS